MSLFIPSVSLSHPNPKKKAKMKTPYHKNKGKVHPSPSSSSSNSSSTTSTNAKDALSILNLLPVAILALASILTVEDREVLAYLVTRSLNTSNPALIIEDKKKCKKSSSANPNSNYSTKNKKSQPIFDCGCFDCYTSYWFRWDSSPNRELINQAIEAFEEHLTNRETSSSSSLMKNNRGGKKRDKLSRRTAKLEKPEPLPPPSPPPPAAQEPQLPVVAELAVVVLEAEVAPLVVSEYSEEEHHHQKAEEVDGKVTTAVQFVPSNNHKGMARKLLPDFIGLFNSRIWNLWSPNI